LIWLKQLLIAITSQILSPHHPEWHQSSRAKPRDLPNTTISRIEQGLLKISIANFANIGQSDWGNK